MLGGLIRRWGKKNVFRNFASGQLIYLDAFVSRSICFFVSPLAALSRPTVSSARARRSRACLRFARLALPGAASFLLALRARKAIALRVCLSNPKP